MSAEIPDNIKLRPDGSIDTAYYLKTAWEAVGDPMKFDAVSDWIRTHPYRGVCGLMDMNNPFQEAAHFPDNGHAPTATTPRGRSTTHPWGCRGRSCGSSSSRR